MCLNWPARTRPTTPSTTRYVRTEEPAEQKEKRFLLCWPLGPASQSPATSGVASDCGSAARTTTPDKRTENATGRRRASFVRTEEPTTKKKNAFP